MVIANKKDSEFFEANLIKFKTAFPDVEVVQISALTEEGISEMKYKLFELISSVKHVEFVEKDREVTIELEESVIIDNPFTGHFEVTGRDVERIFNKIPLNSFDNERRFNQKMKSLGVWSKLKEAGIEDGDTVIIYGLEMVWNEEEF